MFVPTDVAQRRVNAIVLAQFLKSQNLVLFHGDVPEEIELSHIDLMSQKLFAYGLYRVVGDIACDDANHNIWCINQALN